MRPAAAKWFQKAIDIIQKPLYGIVPPLGHLLDMLCHRVAGLLKECSARRFPKRGSGAAPQQRQRQRDSGCGRCVPAGQQTDGTEANPGPKPVLTGVCWDQELRPRQQVCILLQALVAKGQVFRSFQPRQIIQCLSVMNQRF